MGDVKRGDRGDFRNLIGFVLVMGLGVMLVIEAEFGIGNAVWVNKTNEEDAGTTAYGRLSALGLESLKLATAELLEEK